jgi:phenazine biosynthesis protein
MTEISELSPFSSDLDLRRRNRAPVEDYLNRYGENRLTRYLLFTEDGSAGLYTGDTEKPIVSAGLDLLKAHGEWSLKMFPDWRWFNIEIFQTQDPNHIWAECDGEGQILYPDYPPGHYKNHFLHSFQLDDVLAREVVDPGDVREEEVARLHRALEPVGELLVPRVVGVEGRAVGDLEPCADGADGLGRVPPGLVELLAVEQAHVALRAGLVEQLPAHRRAPVARGAVAVEHRHGHEQPHQPVHTVLFGAGGRGEVGVGDPARLDVVGDGELDRGVHGLRPPPAGDQLDHGPRGLQVLAHDNTFQWVRLRWGFRRGG